MKPADPPPRASRRYEPARRMPRILLSTTSSDAHTWNLVFLQMLLEETGHEVVNLGPCVPDDMLLGAARRMQPDAIVVSSVNGHGGVDGARVARLLRSCPETRDIPLMIGGKLGISPAAADRAAGALVDAGYDCVFTDGAGAESVVGELGRLRTARRAPAPLGPPAA